jgi:hypothetical protein
MEDRDMKADSDGFHQNIIVLIIMLKKKSNYLKYYFSRKNILFKK